MSCLCALVQRPAGTTRSWRRPAAAVGSVSVALALVGTATVLEHARGNASTAAPSAAAPSGGPDRLSGRAPFANHLLVYAADALSRAQVRAITSAAGAATPVYSRQLSIRSGLPAYPDIPVSAITVDAVPYARAAGKPDLANALARGAVLSATEAELRHARQGSRLHFSGGQSVVVTAVVDDHLLGGQEMALPRSVGLVPTAAADYLVVTVTRDVARMARDIRQALPKVPLRITRSTRNGFFSSADSVLTQLQVKARFGEFAMRRTGGPGLVQDPAWVRTHLVTAHVPQLGVVTCNRALMRPLIAAMREVTVDGLGATVHTADFQAEGGCWNPNVVPGVAGTVSRHTWGLAVDINVDTNPFGAAPHQNARLVAILRRHGFAWGGAWLRPDAMHFEYVGT
jgi:hypothetical protein